jgi:predicted exporter
MFALAQRHRVLLGVLLCGAMALFVALRFRTTTDMSVFFPEGDQRTKAKISKALSTGELSRTLVITLEGKSSAEAAAMSRRLQTLIDEDTTLRALLAYVNGGPPEGIDEALWRLYNPRKLSFFAANAEQAEAALTDAALEKALQDLAETLALPVSPLLSRVAPEDPFLTVPNLLQSLMSGSPSLAIEDGRYVSQGRFGVLFLATHAPAMHASVQEEIWQRLEGTFHALRRDYPDVGIETSGFARFAQSTQKHMEADISRIATISLVSLTVFCWLLFRSLRLMLLLQVPIAFGMLGALAGTLLIWESVHGVTLAVGASLIGVAMDYVLHFYAHLRLCPDPAGPLATMRHIRVALLLGALTTIVGFAVLGASPFPALMQIATFSAIGVGFALIATLSVVPHLVQGNAPPPPFLIRTSEALTNVVYLFRRRPYLSRGLLLVATLLSVAGMGSIQWQDDLTTLTIPDAKIAAEDARVRQRITSLDTRRVIIALGKDDEEALQTNERIATALSNAQSAGEVDAWQGLAKMLPSAQTQREVLSAVQKANLKQRLPAALERVGFNVEGFEPYLRTLEQPAPAPLTYSELLDSPAADLVRSNRVAIEGLPDVSVAVLTFLRGVHDATAIESRIEAIPGALFIDQTALLTDASRGHRVRTSQLLLVGLVGVFLVLLLQYRNWRSAVSATIPALLAATVTVAVLGLAGVPLNILGLTSLLMVLSLGVDYSVFLVDAGEGLELDSQRGLGATLTGLLVSWVSNLCGFGLLAMSQQPALRLIGLIAGIGVTCALIFAPTALVLAHNGASPLPHSQRTRKSS